LTVLQKAFPLLRGQAGINCASSFAAQVQVKLWLASINASCHISVYPQPVGVVASRLDFLFRRPFFKLFLTSVEQSARTLKNMLTSDDLGIRMPALAIDTERARQNVLKHRRL
jgi:hypothetical protein